MKGKEKRELLRRNLYHDIGLKVSENDVINGQLAFGGMSNDAFKDLSIYRLQNRVPTTISLTNLGFYLKYNGYPIKINLNNDSVYEKEGKLVVEKQ